ncbi:MAG: hypothetical protein LC804_12505, partial [Acidobacteria bacterium]|nr:hypothetical protein [Acidobacteriota bacterium]
YAEVSREPMIGVAACYEVSASYLARVCGHLNVPRPERGYRAKLEVGNAPERPSLPDARVGDASSRSSKTVEPHHSRGRGRYRCDIRAGVCGARACRRVSL